MDANEMFYKMAEAAGLVTPGREGEQLYWGAFAGRLVAFGFHNAVRRGIGITGNEEKYRRLNEFLKVEIPQLVEDEEAIKYLNDFRDKSLKTPL